MGESLKMWNSLWTHVKVAEKDCAAATRNRADEISQEGLQWCTIKFDDTSHSVECRIAIEYFMNNPTVTTAMGISLKDPLWIEMVPNKFQVDTNCWAGELDVFVSQRSFSDEIDLHGHMHEEICGRCYVIPNIVKDYFRLHFAVLNGGTSEGSFFTGLLQTLVRRLTQINAGGHCCVCGRSLSLWTPSSSAPGQILWPCAEALICQATYETWRNVTAGDNISYALPKPTVRLESKPSYEDWPSVSAGNIREWGNEKHEFEKHGTNKKNGVQQTWNRDFKIEHHSYNRPRGWLLTFSSCLRCRFCRNGGSAVDSVGPG